MNQNRFLKCFAFSALALFVPRLTNAADCTASLKPTDEITGVGVFSSAFPSIRNTGMAYWYGVDLWRVDSCYFGYLTVTNSREGDPPYGVLSFRLPPDSNSLSFSSKLSMAVSYQGPDKPGIPTRDLFEFSGTYDKKQIIGTFTYYDKLADGKPITQKTRLRAGQMDALWLTKKGTTYRDWQIDAERMLNMSGPKW